jgi:exopolyphosphatase
MAAPRSALELFCASAKADLDGWKTSDKHYRIVMGNEACDPDSVVTAIVYAFALSQAQLAGQCHVALIPVPRSDFRLQLDRLYLLRRAGFEGSGEGVNWTPFNVVFADEVELQALHASGRVDVILTDHNKLAGGFSFLADRIAGIIDHHKDEGQYTDQVAANSRIIEVRPCHAD